MDDMVADIGRGYDLGSTDPPGGAKFLQAPCLLRRKRAR
jgi:hypothetical protein